MHHLMPRGFALLVHNVSLIFAPFVTNPNVFSTWSKRDDDRSFRLSCMAHFLCAGRTRLPSSEQQFDKKKPDFC